MLTSRYLIFSDESISESPKLIDFSIFHVDIGCSVPVKSKTNLLKEVINRVIHTIAAISSFAIRTNGVISKT